MRERFRVWTEALETFVLEVIFEERRDLKANLARGFLFGSSKLFQTAVKLRRWLYNVRILRDKTLGVQVIAIGNLTVGGTGKTPVVEKFARELRDAGRNVAILSRGYRSKPPPIHVALLNKILLREDPTPPRIVSDGKSLLLDSEMAGDEPYMLASNLKRRGRARGQGPREKRALRHRKIRLRHTAARRRISILETARPAARRGFD